jgi:hypothetical protein
MKKVRFLTMAEEPAQRHRINLTIRVGGGAVTKAKIAWLLSHKLLNQQEYAKPSV